MTETPPPLPEELRSTGVDLGVAGFKALCSVVPAGGFVAELISAVVPEQRADRFARYLAKVEAALKALEQRIDAADAHRLEPEQIALFEAGGAAAVKVIADSQLDRIAQVVAEGLTEGEARAARLRREIHLIAELTDDDIVELCSFVEPYKTDADWQALHGDVLWTYARYRECRQAGMSPDEMQRRDVDSELRKSRLIASGLLEQTSRLDLEELLSRLRLNEEGGLSLAHKSGKRETDMPVYSSENEISYLGLAVLRTLKLWEPKTNRTAAAGADPTASTG